MFLNRLEASHLRNLASVSIRPVPGLNLLVGPNGSGKTSFLEAIHILGLGRSFRSPKIDGVITRGEEALVVFGEGQDSMRHRLGVKKHRRSGSVMQVDGHAVTGAAELASVLPLQTITPDSHVLISGGPRERRHFIDWGLFHVEQDFYRDWKGFERSLRQRNALLRAGGDQSELAHWTKALVSYGSAIDRYRREYVSAFKAVANTYVQSLADGMSLEISYQSGWPRDTGFAEALEGTMERDRGLGYTSVGPHRGDLAIRTEGHPAAAILSRGQQKLVVCALRLAQIRFLEDRIQRKPLVLVDDLAAELDAEHRARLMALLAGTGCQVFVTGTDAGQIPVDAWTEHPIRLFHVEHGTVSEML